MISLSPAAADTIRLVREMDLADESTIRLLEQLFSSVLDVDLLHSLVDGKEQRVAAALFKVANNVHSPHIVGFVLRFLADLVMTATIIGEQFGIDSPEKIFGDDPAKMFLFFLSRHSGERGIEDPALYLAATALRHGPPERNKESLQRFFGYVRSAFSQESPQVSTVAFAVQGCAVVARRKSLRRYFFDEQIVGLLPHLLTNIVATDSASIIQCIYRTLLVSWLLSYEYRGVIQLKQHKMIPHLHRVMQRLQKEKCIRVALMTLWNMVQAEQRFLAHITDVSSTSWVSVDICELSRLNNGKGPCFIAEMVGIGMLKTLSQLSRRKFGDEDISTLIYDLQQVLEQSMEKLTSFSEYRGEVMSGALEWTPVHTSIKFWKESIFQFEQNSYEVIAELGKIIMTTHQDLSLAVACHDLGEIVRHHPTGRALLLLPQLAGVKERIMELMSHPNGEVSKNALLALQKIMVQRWEYIQQQPQK